MLKLKLNSWNINGIRGIYNKKGFMDWFNSVDSDIISFQEIKAQLHQIPKELLHHIDYYSYFNPSKQKGFNGLAIFSKNKTNEIISEMGMEEFDKSGRFLRLDFNDFILINICLPSASENKSKLEFKLNVFDYFIEYLDDLKGEKIIISGDFNTAHTELDIANPQKHKNKFGFKDIEREKIDDLISKGFSDTFRMFNSLSDHYTWWPYRGDARTFNLGRRLDYFFVSNNLTSNILKSSILPDIEGSDHAPIELELEL